MQYAIIVWLLGALGILAFISHHLGKGFQFQAGRWATYWRVLA